MLRYDIRTGVKKIKTKTALAISGATLGFAGLIAAIAIPLGAHASGTAIYNNIPNTIPGNVPSVSFEATGTSEFGGQVSFAGTARTSPVVTVLMSSWGCVSGHWTSGDCLTTPGTTFSEPITLNVYNVGAGNTPGSLVTTVTQTFNIPFRPSADNTNCTGTQVGEWFNGTSCFNGLATPISFDLTGVTLPNNAILSVAYNTSDYGYAPIGRSTACSATAAGCGYDSLNVGTEGAATVGTQPVPDSAYQLTQFDSCTNGAVKPFGIDSPCWTGFQPAITVTASEPTVQGFVTGGLTLSGPRQQISFNAFDTGVNSASDYGTVEYQNFEFAGGLHYTANILCANVSSNKATFLFQIPVGSPLAGTYVVASVTDGGSPGKGHDTYGHTTAPDLASGLAMCESNTTTVTNYSITGGNAVIHKQ